MDNNQYKNIVINEDFAVNSDERFSSLLDKGGINYLPAKDLEDFYRLIQVLDEELMVHIWIHPSFGKKLITKQTTSGMMAISSLSNIKDINFEIVTSVEESSEVEQYARKYSKKAINILDLDEYARRKTPKSIRTIKSILNFNIRNKNSYRKFNIGILTALYQWELENIINCFGKDSWKLDEIKVENRLYHTLKITLRNSKEVTLIAASQRTMGMIDAAIIGTEMINLFSPDYLVMTGVCGAKPDDFDAGKADIESENSKKHEEISFGDIIVPNKLFTFQKGKFTENGFEHELEECLIDEKILQIVETNQVNLIKSITTADTSRDYSTKPLRIHIEPMACSTAVINEPGKFDEIKNIERKVIAVNMESYSIARACEISNEKKTKALIIKSVMDKTHHKNDDSKPFAAYTSAQFLRYLLEFLEYTF